MMMYHCHIHLLINVFKECKYSTSNQINSNQSIPQPPFTQSVTFSLTYNFHKFRGPGKPGKLVFIFLQQVMCKEVSKCCHGNRSMCPKKETTSSCSWSSGMCHQSRGSPQNIFGEELLLWSGPLGLKRRLSSGERWEKKIVSIIIVIMQVLKNREKMFPEKHGSSNAFIF